MNEKIDPEWQKKMMTIAGAKWSDMCLQAIGIFIADSNK